MTTRTFLVVVPAQRAGTTKKQKPDLTSQTSNPVFDTASFFIQEKN